MGEVDSAGVAAVLVEAVGDQQAEEIAAEIAKLEAEAEQLAAEIAGLTGTADPFANQGEG